MTDTDMDRLREIGRLRAALKPFADVADIFDFRAGNRPQSGPVMQWADHRVDGTEREITVEMLQAARKALEKPT